MRKGDVGEETHGLPLCAREFSLDGCVVFGYCGQCSDVDAALEECLLVGRVLVIGRKAVQAVLVAHGVPGIISTRDRTRLQ